MSVEVHCTGGIMTIRLSRPDKLNALSLAMYDALGQAFLQAAQDDAVRVVLLTGAGRRAFCVGADLIESIPALAEDRFDISAWDPAHLKNVPLYKPVICAIQGLCIGGGFEIMLATDLRIASEDAVFQLPEPTHGFVPAGGTLVRLVRQIGYAHAMEILLTARRFSSRELLDRGILNRVVPAADVEATAMSMAEHLATLSTTALQTIKEAALTLQDLPLRDAFAAEARLGQRTFTSEDARRGLASFASRGGR
ncbi:MAG: enoyl-CoA hydratase/isomerase family protein [Methylobacterium frigidaeris]